MTFNKKEIQVLEAIIDREIENRELEHESARKFKEKDNSTFWLRRETAAKNRIALLVEIKQKLK